MAEFILGALVFMAGVFVGSGIARGSVYYTSDKTDDKG